MYNRSCLLVLALVTLTGCTQEEEERQEQPLAKPPAAIAPVIPEPVEPKHVPYADVPKACLQYRELIEKFADCPARRASLMEQESSCNQYATSPYADGLWQLTPGTCDDLAASMCRDLGPCQPFNTEWSTQCATRKLEKETNGDYSQSGIRTGEMRYNGGYWVVWEMETAKRAGLAPTIDNAQSFCGEMLYNGRQRNKKHCAENYEYYKHIERRLVKYEDYAKGKC